MNLNTMPVLTIAGNEFKQTVGHPLVMIASIVLVVFAVLNGMGGVGILEAFEGSSDPGDVIASVGFGQVLYSTAFLCTVLAVFIGAMSVVSERSKNSFPILLTKPLYRRDLIVGKLLGLNLFMLLFVAINLIVCALFMILFYKAPASLGEFWLRLSGFVVLLFMECSLSLGLLMLAGIVFNDMLKVAVLSVTYIYADWYSYVQMSMGSLALLSPKYLFFSIVLGDGTLLDTTTPISSWLTNFGAHILFLIACICAVLVLDCLVFIRSDES